MILDSELLARFEKGLDTIHPERSAIPARVLGYGEISCIFLIEGAGDAAYKRMPLFPDMESARRYESNYHQYCGLLEKAGIALPDTATALIEVPGRPVSLYIAQPRLEPGDFLNAKIKEADEKQALAMVDAVAGSLCRVADFNRANAPRLELGIDGQISNWAMPCPENDGNPLFLDTSTPLFKVGGVETMNPELLLKATPFFLRFIARRFFLGEVMTRYYDLRRVFTDIAGNLYKEQMPYLVDGALGVLNGRLPAGALPITKSEVEGYYRMDKIIWQSFLALRKTDRFLQAGLGNGRYSFILPGKIRR